MPEATVETKQARLRDRIASFGSLLVAYSGGVDSSLVAAVGHQVLGDRMLAVTADSASLAREELIAATAQAAARGWRHRVIATAETSDPRYLANDARRCFFCKDELYTCLQAIAKAEGFSAIANGANVDDLGDYRPGMDAARKFAITSPLVDAGMTKADIRSLARGLGLPAWDKPAQPCLSSRVPYGTPVTIEVLKKIEQAESALRAAGFTEARVRHHGDIARLEVPLHLIERFADPAVRDAVLAGVRQAGYRWVTVDLAGLKSGGLNELLPVRATR
jgi:uncharacterized protein